jgi:anti-anti-sigma regulatory factor
MYGTGAGDERTSCVVVQRYDTTVILLGGSLDQAGVEQVENDVRWTLGHCDDDVGIIDATAVDDADGWGLRLIEEAETMAARHHVELMVRPSDALRELRAVAARWPSPLEGIPSCSRTT